MATASKNPTDIARETIRQLAVRRIPPTPDHYREIYADIAGASLPESFPERALKQLSAEIGRVAALPGLLHALADALSKKDWTAFNKALTEQLSDLVTVQQLSWSALIRDLIRQWENSASRLTIAQKRETLEHVLQSSGGNPGTLFSRLENLNKSWAQSREGESLPLEALESSVGVARVASLDDSGLTAELLTILRETFVYALENCVRVFLNGEERLTEKCRKLVEEVRYANSPKQLFALQHQLKGFAFQIELLDEDHRELRESLLKLLRLVVENVGELVLDDQWIRGQIEIVRGIVDQPLSQKNLDDAEHRFKEIVFRQSQLKLGLQEAQDALKAMLAGFVDHLTNFTDATSDYHDKICAIAERISQADKLTDLEVVLDEVMRETRHIQANARHSRDELTAARTRARETEARIQALEKELEEASRLIQHDQLTGVLNRRGLEEVGMKEIRRAERRRSSLCLALLDIDNFKRLNDSLGHSAGDEALLHLTSVVRASLRPEDSMARFGGEEFVILFPDTRLHQAENAMVRVQRELTRHIFLYNNQKVLITFSAGVALRHPEEQWETMLQRADAAMYQAKQAGKNQVVLADTEPEADDDAL